MELLAHSAKGTAPPQSYSDHVGGVHRRAVRYAEEAQRYCALGPGDLANVVAQAARYHDFGKLDPKNQAVLRGDERSRHLPVDHVDAGVAYLQKDSDENLLSSLTVSAHHRGLPDLPQEKGRGDAIFRDEDSAVRRYVDGELETLTALDAQAVHLQTAHTPERFGGDLPVFLRLALSCLADGDHTDTAVNYGQPEAEDRFPDLRAAERLAALDAYVARLGTGDERSRLRAEMYEDCRNIRVDGPFAACDSPVGSGKTTAVMAYLLHTAHVRKARRVFVVLPYTNIITQSVDVYRKALTLPGEDPEAVVAELHHRVDLEDESLRYLTALWRAPIVVTTAVAFYETLASNRPAALRRLHQLPGSVIFVDEAHAALPLHLLPTAWRWMRVFGEEWSCHWVLASGSLVRYWSIPELIPEKAEVPELIGDPLRDRLAIYEKERVLFRWEKAPLSRRELMDKVAAAPGPRLLILNTVQRAAVIARDLRDAYGRERVEHLSTALTPEDRAATIQTIKARLKDPSDTDWTLVATSCVEAGVDFSFRVGFREAASLLSLLQAAGRVNREGRWPGAEMWSFQLQDDPLLGSQNPQIQDATHVLMNYFERGKPIAPCSSTASLVDELNQGSLASGKISALRAAENSGSFETVAQKFVVIDADTVPVVVDAALASAVAHGDADWRQLQKRSVSIWRHRVKKLCLPEIAPGVFQWNLDYDPFLGYMAGALAWEGPGSAAFS